MVCANKVDPDQTPRLVASDLGLHCLSISLSSAEKHKWVKIPFILAKITSETFKKTRPSPPLLQNMKNQRKSLGKL